MIKSSLAKMTGSISIQSIAFDVMINENGLLCSFALKDGLKMCWNLTEVNYGTGLVHNDMTRILKHFQQSFTLLHEFLSHIKTLNYLQARIYKN